MSRQTIIEQINKLVRQLQLIRGFQSVTDFFFIYLTYCILISEDTLNFFGREFTQSNAFIMVMLVAIINICLALLKRNYRQSGRQLTNQLEGELTDDERKKIKLFY